MRLLTWFTSRPESRRKVEARPTAEALDRRDVPAVGFAGFGSAALASRFNFGASANTSPIGQVGAFSPAEQAFFFSRPLAPSQAPAGLPPVALNSGPAQQNLARFAFQQARVNAPDSSVPVRHQGQQALLPNGGQARFGLQPAVRAPQNLGTLTPGQQAFFFSRPLAPSQAPAGLPPVALNSGPAQQNLARFAF